MEAAPSMQMLLFDRMGFWVSLLSMFSTVLLGVFGILAANLGFLVWKNNDMRKRSEEGIKKAEEAIERIGEMVKKIEVIYLSTSKMGKTIEGEFKKVKKMVSTIKTIKEMVEKNKLTKKEKEKLKTKIGTISKDLSDIQILDRDNYLPIYEDYFGSSPRPIAEGEQPIGYGVNVEKLGGIMKKLKKETKVLNLLLQK